METGERDHVDGKLTEIGVELAGEAEAGSDARHRRGDEMVEVGVRRRGQLQRPEADVVQSLVVDAVSLVCVLDQLMH